MSYGDYYNPSNKVVSDGEIVYADDLNKINSAVDSAFEQVATDLEELAADLEDGGTLARDWATEDAGTRPDPVLDLYSARAYAIEAKGWAQSSSTVVEASTGVALAGSASAKTKAQEAAASALAASNSASSASISAGTATTKAGEASDYADAASISESNASDSAIAAAASAANLPNATTAGANKIIVTNSAGTGWEYPAITAAGKALLDDATASDQLTTLGITAAGKALLDDATASDQLTTLGITAAGKALLDDATASDQLTTLGITAAGKALLDDATASDQLTTLGVTVAGKALLDDADAAAQRATLGFASDALTRPRKNLLINGGFDVWQDGPGPFTADGYCADGWYFRHLIAHGNSASRAGFGPIEVATPRSPKYCLNLVAAPVNGCSASARIEYLPQFSGKTLTCSFWTTRLVGSGELDVQLNSNFGTGGTPTTTFRPVALSPGGVIFPVTTVFERRTATFTVPDLSSYTLGTTEGTSYLELEFSFLNIVASSSICAIADVQLEFGDTATDFEYRHPAEELMLCQRYYEKGTLRGPFAQYSTNFAVGPQVSFLVEKLKNPLVTLGALSTTGNDGTRGALYDANENTRGINPVYNWTGGTVGRSFFGQATWTADARL